MNKPCETSIENVVFTDIRGMVPGSERIAFTTVDSQVYIMFHEQDCCESVQLLDVIGDVSDLLNTPILSFTVATNSKDTPIGEGDDSCTWTFYEFQTQKGHVTLRWYGSSNGYYSERVDFKLAPDNTPLATLTTQDRFTSYYMWEDVVPTTR
jgi:hypothetical protein